MANILVIDDEDPVLEFMKQSFEPIHTIHAFPNWSSAMAKASDGSIDLALIDYRLRGFQGDDIVRFLINLKLPRVYLFSAGDPVELQAVAKECGAHGVIKKELLYAPLLRQITELLGEKSGNKLKRGSGTHTRVTQRLKKYKLLTPETKEELVSSLREDSQTANIEELVRETRNFKREEFLEKHQHYALLQLNEFERIAEESTHITKTGRDKMGSGRLDPKKSVIFFIRSRGGNPQTRVFTVGRSKDSDIVIRQDLVSKYHAVIRQDAGGLLTIEDSNSRNGTFLDGNQLKPHVDAALERGNIVGFSKVLLFKLLSPEDLFVRIRMYRSVFDSN